MLKNKKILLICKETYSYPFYFLAKELLKDNLVASYFFNPPESVYKKCLFNENTYFKHKEIQNLIVYDNNDILEIFSKHIKNPPIDWKFLEDVEKTYTKHKSLMHQILTSQFFSRTFHDRFYLNHTSYEQQLYWLELNYKKIIELFDKFKPDVILDLDTAELSRAVITEVAYERQIPYITIGHSRFEMFKIPSFSIIWINKYFYSIFKEKQSLDYHVLSEEYQYIENFRNKKKIMSKEYDGSITSNYTRDSLFKIFKYVIGVIQYFINQEIISGNLFLKRKNDIFFPSSLKFIWFLILMEIKKWFLLGKNKFFINPEKNAKYVYMPLHLIPESSTFVLAPYYVNELFIIEQVSKSLPVGWFLYVKEHQSMVGQRKINFYRKVNKLPNVKMVSLNYYNDPKPWILNSIGVITITGTSAYEAALLGKKSITFGEIPFNVIEGITRVSSFEDLPRLISTFGEVDNIHSCAAYLATVKEIGTEVNLNYLMSEGEQILLEKKPLTDKYQSEILALKQLYEKAYTKYSVATI